MSATCHYKGKLTLDAMNDFLGSGASTLKLEKNRADISFYSMSAYGTFVKRIMHEKSWNIGGSIVTFGNVDITDIVGINNNPHDVITWNDGSFHPFHAKIDIVVLEDGDIPLLNVSGIVGMFYSMIERSSSIASTNMHDGKSMKPWSFSSVRFQHRPLKVDGKKGFYRIKKGSRASWFFNTLDGNVMQLLIHSLRDDNALHLHSLPMRVERFPEDVRYVTMQFHSPTFMTRISRNQGCGKKTLEKIDINGANLLDFQTWKLDMLGLISKGVEPSSIKTLLRVVRDDTSERTMFITRKDGNGVIPFKGRQGYMTFKLNGTMEEREMVWKILWLSQFTGIGSKTGMGFGHCSIKSWK